MLKTPQAVEQTGDPLSARRVKAQARVDRACCEYPEVVARCTDSRRFSRSRQEIREREVDTRSIEVLLFTGSSNNNEKRIFYFGEAQKEGLSGVDVKNIVDEEVQRKLREKEYEVLKDENKKLQQHIADLESEVDE